MPDLSGLPSEFWAALLGAIVGGVVTVAGQLIVHRVTTSEQRKLRGQRKNLLKKLLDNPPSGKEWMEMATLSRVIGANEDETAGLLIKLGARASKKDKNVWAWIKDKPLTDEQ